MTKNISQLLAQVDTLARKHSQPDLATRILIPLVSLMSLGLIPSHTPADPNKLKYVEMPEEWLADVATAPDLTEKGLLFLAGVLQKKRRIMVSDGVTWANIEKGGVCDEALLHVSSDATSARIIHQLSPAGAALWARATSR